MKLKKSQAVLLSLIMAVSHAAHASCSKGKASYYGKRFHGKTTASGTPFDQNALTAAHKTLPFGTRLTVKNKNNHKVIVVTITDRGPFIKGRDLDLSKGAMKKLGGISSGVIPVTYCIKSKPATKRKSKG